MNLSLSFVNIILLLCGMGSLIVIPVVGQENKNICRVSYYDFKTDKGKEIGDFKLNLVESTVVRTYKIPNSTLLVTVGLHSDKISNDLVLSLVIGKVTFKGNAEEFKSGNFLNNSSTSFLLSSFEQGAVTTIIVEKKQLRLITLECSSKK